MASGIHMIGTVQNNRQAEGTHAAIEVQAKETAENFKKLAGRVNEIDNVAQALKSKKPE